MRPVPSILVLAAGRATRMRGADKLLEEIDGTPLILRAVRAALRAAPEVVVTLPPASPRRAWLADAPVRIVEVDGPMSASLAAGIAAVTRDAATVHLADMPGIGAPELSAMAAAWTRADAPILRATAADGTPGQPVTFARSLFPELAALIGDVGARAVIARHGAHPVALPARAALTDLDTPEDWAAWRAMRRAADSKPPNS
ncbi:nucleotidyltransferase family protein [Jannaschia sp. Os4]|uniref:nucleotidyltransferase family protein n=1 Tax=Jannaschia sp. Os4 TaxID=2807617 RepID=UPI0019398051|nr:nucleotidyltransferase family protein [Jannaschia sp. Os4]MBM2576540.1 nucleotidyltransferase family protein [Jannaschia sp. Os4]